VNIKEVEAVSLLLLLWIFLLDLLDRKGQALDEEGDQLLLLRSPLELAELLVVLATLVVPQELVVVDVRLPVVAAVSLAACGGVLRLCLEVVVAILLFFLIVFTETCLDNCRATVDMRLASVFRLGMLFFRLVAYMTSTALRLSVTIAQAKRTSGTNSANAGTPTTTTGTIKGKKTNPATLERSDPSGRRVLLLRPSAWATTAPARTQSFFFFSSMKTNCWSWYQLFTDALSLRS